MKSTKLAVCMLFLLASLSWGSVIPNILTDSIPVTPSSYIGAAVHQRPFSTVNFYLEDLTDNDFNDLYGRGEFGAVVDGLITFTITLDGGLSAYTPNNFLVSGSTILTYFGQSATRTMTYVPEAVVELSIYNPVQNFWHMTPGSHGLIIQSGSPATTDTPEPATMAVGLIGVLLVIAGRKIR